MCVQVVLNCVYLWIFFIHHSTSLIHFTSFFLCLYGNKLCMFWPINFETWIEYTTDISLKISGQQIIIKHNNTHH